LGGAALEVELEEGFRAAAVDDLDPGVGGGRFVLAAFDDGVGFAALALEVQLVTVTFAFIAGSRDDGDAVGQPLRHAARVGDEVEDVLDGDADGAGIRQRHWSHVGIIWLARVWGDRKSTRLNSSHVSISYAVFCLKKKKKKK